MSLSIPLADRPRNGAVAGTLTSCLQFRASLDVRVCEVRSFTSGQPLCCAVVNGGRPGIRNRPQDQNMVIFSSPLTTCRAMAWQKDCDVRKACEYLHLILGDVRYGVGGQPNDS